MNITFEKSKACSCYEELVNNEIDRSAQKEFKKHFSKELLSAALKTHQKLKSAPNAAIYNSTSTPNNTIQLKQGVKENESLILKIRVQEAYRKFFNYVSCIETNKFCLQKEWNGQFKDISTIHVFDVNKHDYN